MTVLSLSQPFDFRNDSEVDIPPYGLILCREIVTRSADKLQFLKGEAPIAADVNHLYRNGGNTVPPGGYGACYLGDILAVAYALEEDKGKPEVGQCWGIKPGEADDFKLHCGYGGWEVLEAPTDDETELVIVRRMRPHILTGLLQTTADAPTNGWTDPTSQHMTIYRPLRTDTGAPIDFESQGTAAKAIARNITHRDASAEIAGGAFIRVIWQDGEWAPLWTGC